jgi:Domain of Unknown Function with PDB structure (DUF3857)
MIQGVIHCSKRSRFQKHAQPATASHPRLYRQHRYLYTSFVNHLRPAIALLALLCASLCALPQQPPQKPAERPSSQAPEAREHKPELPFRIQLLETHIRFESNGDSRKEVHTIVKIINILGARQFSRVSFDYDRAFQQVEIPMVHIMHANGGTSELLPSAVVDAPNPAVEQFPAYHNVRVKAVRILGLQEGDTVEYRVITTITHHPLAPNFWVEHTFDRSGQVLHELYELDIPASRASDMRISPSAPPPSSQQTTGRGEDEYTVYTWRRTYTPPKDSEQPPPPEPNSPDIGVSTLTWETLAIRLAELMLPGSKPIAETKTREESIKELSRQPEIAEPVRDKAVELTAHAKSDVERLKGIYDFVSSNIPTVDLPPDATGFHARGAEEVLNSGYATAEDKYVLFAALASAVQLRTDPALTGFCDKSALPLPSVFKHLVVVASTKERQYWLDPAVEVAPFGMISPTPAKCALLLSRSFYETNSTDQEWVNVPTQTPFAAFQRVSVDAVISDSGQLTAKVKYILRGENELILRLAFHQTPKEKWKDVAGLLAVSDGFRGQVTAAEASDPTSTDDPFRVEYELTQLKFVDWSKKPVRIPALLPLIGLPDPSVAAPMDQGPPVIELGTPLEVQTNMILHLPQGTGVETPPGTSVARDYATFSSKYSATQNTVTASRRITFLRRSIPTDSAVDYNAFVHAVQNDQQQRLTLVTE